MTSLLSQGIASLCMGLASSGQYSDACNKAIDAGTRQVGIRQEADKIENSTSLLVAKEANNTLGKDVVFFIGASAFVYNVQKGKSVTFKLPSLGIANSINNQIMPGYYRLNIQWNF